MIYQVTQKAAGFEWRPEQEKALHQVYLLYKVFCHLDHMTLQIHWCLKHQWQMWVLFVAFGRLLQVNYSIGP